MPVPAPSTRRSPTRSHTRPCYRSRRTSCHSSSQWSPTPRSGPGLATTARQPGSSRQSTKLRPGKGHYPSQGPGSEGGGPGPRFTAAPRGEAGPLTPPAQNPVAPVAAGPSAVAFPVAAGRLAVADRFGGGGPFGGGAPGRSAGRLAVADRSAAAVPGSVVAVPRWWWPVWWWRSRSAAAAPSAVAALVVAAFGGGGFGGGGSAAAASAVAATAAAAAATSGGGREGPVADLSDGRRRRN